MAYRIPTIKLDNIIITPTIKANNGHTTATIYIPGFYLSTDTDE